ncbi:MAG: hypothetical protein AB1750_14265 [Chloroflexota bacterium]
MKTKFKTLFALAVPILLTASLGCSISFFAAPTPTPTHTSTPTSTATMTPSITPSPTATATFTATPLPEPPLDILACAPNSDAECPEESVTITSLFPGQTLRDGREYAVTITADKQIRFFLGWCTRTEDLLEPNLQEMEWVFTIDGESFVRLLKGRYYTSKDDSTPPNDIYCYSTSGVVSGWKSGETYRIAFGFNILGEINDGWDTYSPSEFIRTYIITVK